MTSTMSHNDHVWSSMAAHGKPHHETDAPKFTAVNDSYLQTPEEPSADSFSYEETAHDAAQAWRSKLPPIQRQGTPQQQGTPPASPLPSIADATGFAKHEDAPLFPESQTDNSQTPLFLEPEPSPSATPAQTVPIQPVEVEAPHPSSPSPYMRFPWTGITTTRGARDYYQSRLNELAKIPRVGRILPKPSKSKSPERDSVSAQQVRRLSRTSGVTKPQSQPRPAPRPKASIAASPVQRTPPPRRRTPAKSRTTTSDFLHDAWPQSSQPAKHKRAPPSKKVEDSRHWSELPDYTPPTDSLNAPGVHLKATWDGNNRDASQDPDSHHLHPQEVQLASTLRLEASRYLLTKRQIFQARLQALKDGRASFTKTAAQGACGIDVNKASKLWEAFSAVGWFEEAWFKKYLSTSQ